MNQHHTFLVERADLGVRDPGALQPGAHLTLPEAEARHAHVRRITVGEEVAVADGAGYLILARCLSAPSAGAATPFTVEVQQVTYQEPPQVELHLVQALAKNDRDEQAIEMATELGVMAVTPWQADRSVVQWRGKKIQKGQQRWQQVVRAAAKQSRRAWVPQVRGVVASNELATLIQQWVAQGQTVLVMDGQGGPMPTIPPRGTCTVVIGPEGGISAPEIAAFTAAGAHHIRLGPHTMRASSAGPAALAVLNWRTGVYGPGGE